MLRYLKPPPLGHWYPMCQILQSAIHVSISQLSTQFTVFDAQGLQTTIFVSI